jgi:pimeloyl-ACP methyl ester carboxylesterase
MMHMRSLLSCSSLIRRLQHAMPKSSPADHNTQRTAGDIPAPNAMLLALEGRAPWELGATLASWPLLRVAKRLPKGDGHSVIVFPGLSAGDLSTKPLRSFIADLGYTTQGWHQGLNFGPRQGVINTAREQLQKTYASSGRKVSLIGWSLGGIYARELAKLEPELVRCVITLGTPFAGSPKSTNAWRLYELLSGGKAQHQEHGPLHEAPPVPCTSLYSRSDGIVAWQCSVQAPSADNPHTENIEVMASHFGIGLNSTAWYAVADRLAQAEGAWQRFDTQGSRRMFFKSGA